MAAAYSRIRDRRPQAAADNVMILPGANMFGVLKTVAYYSFSLSVVSCDEFLLCCAPELFLLPKE